MSRPRSPAALAPSWPSGWRDASPRGFPPETGAAAVLIATATARLEEVAREAEARFHQQLRRVAIDCTWYTERGMAVEIRIARRAVVVLGQYDPDHPGVLAAPEDLVLSCGGPVLLVPFAGSFLTVGEKVLVAWNGSREATRALHAALAVIARPPAPSQRSWSTRAARS